MSSRVSNCIVKAPRAVTPIAFKFFPNGSDTGSLTVDDYGSGRVTSVARTSNAGEYLVTMADPYYAAGPINASLSMGTLPTTVALETPTTAAVTNEGNGSDLTFLVRVRGTTFAVSGVAALTDSSAGTPGATIAALPNPTDTPSTADELRDDLVAVHWPILRNWAASFATNVNALAALATYGTLAGYDVPASATNYIKVQMWVFDGSVPA